MTNESDDRKKRRRRTLEELIADLEQEKDELVERLKTSDLRTSPAHRAALGAVRHIDRALELAAQEDESALRTALAESRRVLGEYLETKGVRLPGGAHAARLAQPE
jgi:cell division septum initiation protein DivIVA